MPAKKREKRREALPPDEVREAQRVIQEKRGEVPGLVRRPGPKRSPSPSELKRRKRVVAVTFTHQKTPSRLRKLARAWGLTGPDGQRPNVSAVVEFLLLPQLERAEAGEIGPPEN